MEYFLVHSGANVDAGSAKGAGTVFQICGGAIGVEFRTSGTENIFGMEKEVRKNGPIVRSAHWFLNSLRFD